MHACPYIYITHINGRAYIYITFFASSACMYSCMYACPTSFRCMSNLKAAFAECNITITGFEAVTLKAKPDQAEITFEN